MKFSLVKLIHSWQIFKILQVECYEKSEGSFLSFQKPQLRPSDLICKNDYLNVLQNNTGPSAEILLLFIDGKQYLLVSKRKSVYNHTDLEDKRDEYFVFPLNVNVVFFS